MNVDCKKQTVWESNPDLSVRDIPTQSDVGESVHTTSRSVVEPITYHIPDLGKGCRLTLRFTMLQVTWAKCP